jgi:hypothetical protein
MAGATVLPPSSKVWRELSVCCRLWSGARRSLKSSGHSCVRRTLGIAAIAVGLSLWGAVSYGKGVVQRGARWTGFSFEGGIALVYECDPAFRIVRAYFYLWPFKRVALQKMPTGA